MKKLEFETSKGRFVLMDMSDKESILYASSCLTKFENWEGIKMSNIDEEEASYIVDKNIGYKNYLESNDLISNFSCVTALKSLKSLIKSKGVYLYEKPYLPEELINNQEAFMADLKAEQKTFYNPYIFKLCN